MFPWSVSIGAFSAASDSSSGSAPDRIDRRATSPNAGALSPSPVGAAGPSDAAAALNPLMTGSWSSGDSGTSLAPAAGQVAPAADSASTAVSARLALDQLGAQLDAVENAIALQVCTPLTISLYQFHFYGYVVLNVKAAIREF